MLKFLRKYNKWIMVFGGSLLMIAFLAPQAIQNLPKIRDKTVAQYNGNAVKESELMDANAELRAINALGGNVKIANLLLNLSAPTNEQDIEWYMLSREAEEAGFVGSDGDAINLYPIIAQQLATYEADSYIQQTRQQLNQLQRAQLIQSRIEPWMQRVTSYESNAAGAGRFRTIEDARKAFAKLHGVLRMQQAFDRIGKFSTSRATRAGTETFNGAEIDYLVIPAERFIASSAEPTEEAIAAHFEKYADVIPSESDFGIGYRQPQQIKLEWLTIAITGIEDAITIDPVEASKHQQLNKEDFPGEFSEERPRIDAALKRTKAQTIVEQAENIIQAEILRDTRTLDTDSDYLSLPEDWQTTRSSLEDLAQLIVTKVEESNNGLQIPLPSIERHTDKWLGANDIFSLPGIGFSSIQFGSQRLQSYQALFAVRELNPNPNFPIQVGLLASEFPLDGFDGSKHFFRVLDSRQISPPESVEEVREQVVTDLKRIEAYEQLVAELPGYAEVAVNAGLEEVANAVNAGLPESGEATDENTPSRVEIANGATIRSRIAQSTPFVFRDEDVLAVAFDATRPLDPTVKIEDMPLPAKTFHAAAPKALSVVVGRVSKLLPLTAEDFAVSYDQLKSSLMQLEASEIDTFEYPYTYENLKKRHNFIDLTSRQSSENPAPVSDVDSSTDDTTEESGSTGDS
jgi:hypothetical protein